MRENNQAGNFTHTWTYDSAGNITARTEYAYTTGELGTPTDTVAYTYGNTNWGDLLTAYDGTAFTYETTSDGNTIGNLLSDGTWTYTWQHGRQLASMCNNNGTGDDTSDDVTWLYTYNADGMRTKRTNGAFVYEYVYNGSQLSRMTVSHRTSRTLNTLYFAYDASGVPMSVTYDSNNTDTTDGITYYYITNIQGDVTGIVDSTGTQVVSYTYDAWGNHLDTTGTLATTLGTHNPLRYRSYVYDQETELYYLQSRYYNPELGRFLNADAFAATGQGFIGNNMFAYCLNNPSNSGDDEGHASDSYSGWMGEQIGIFLYELITGKDHPATQAAEIENEIISQQTDFMLDSVSVVWETCMQSCNMNQQNRMMEDHLMANFWRSDFAHDAVESAQVGGALAMAVTVGHLILSGGASWPVALGQLAISYFSGATQSFIAEIILAIKDTI